MLRDLQLVFFFGQRAGLDFDRPDLLLEFGFLAPHADHLALVGAGSIDKLEGARATLNWAIGAAIAPAAYPGQSMVTLLVGFNDATNGYIHCRLAHRNGFIASIIVNLVETPGHSLFESGFDLCGGHLLTLSFLSVFEV